MIKVREKIKLKVASPMTILSGYRAYFYDEIQIHHSIIYTT